MKANILTLAITLTVGIILAGSLLMPVITDASTDELTGDNAYYFRMSEIGDKTVTLSYDSTGNLPLIDGEHKTYTNSNGTNAINLAVISDSFIVSTTGSLWYYYFVYEGVDYQIYSTATGAPGAIATIGNGEMQLYINETTSYTLPYTTCYIPDNSGDYAMCQEQFNGLFEKSDVLVVSVTFRANHGVAIGNVDDLTTKFHATDGTVDTDTYTFEVVYDTQTVGLTDLCKTKYDSYRYIVPYEYHYQDDNDYAALYSALPVLVIVGLVLAATPAIILRRD